MKINNINTTPYFTGIYRIPIKALYNEETVDMIREQYYERMADDIVTIIGETPFSQALNEKITETSEKMGYSDTWLKANAANYGLDLESVNADYAIFITGKKDINALLSIANDKKVSYKTYDQFSRYANRVFEPKETFHDIFSAIKYPAHLYDIASRLSAVERYTKKFFETLGKKMKDVESEEELIKEIFTEDKTIGDKL